MAQARSCRPHNDGLRGAFGAKLCDPASSGVRIDGSNELSSRGDAIHAGLDDDACQTAVCLCDGALLMPMRGRIAVVDA